MRRKEIVGIVYPLAPGHSLYGDAFDRPLEPVVVVWDRWDRPEPSSVDVLVMVARYTPLVACVGQEVARRRSYHRQGRRLHDGRMGKRQRTGRVRDTTW